MVSMQEVSQEVISWIERMGKDYGRVYGPFAVWMRRVEEKGALDTNAALDAGATKDQVMEACFVACLFRGAPACMYSQLVMNAVEEYQSIASSL
jgi:hypothetical protein